VRRLGLWLRWSGRDLRARWVQVAAIALIIAVGSGFYSGLSSTSAWRRQSYDASYRQSQMYDLRLTLSTGSYLGADQLRSITEQIPSAADVAGSNVRLVGAVQVDASTGERTVIVPGSVVGIDLSAGAGAVSTLSVNAGRVLDQGDDGADVAVLDPQVARFYDLPPTGTISLNGGQQLEYVGTGFTPEYFVSMDAAGHPASAGGYATVFTSLGTAQRLLGLPGQANELLVRVAPGADATQVRSEIDAAMAAAAPAVGFVWTTGADDPGRQLLYDGVDGTQRLYTIFAVLLLAGAAFGAFNLTARIVEAQRREIGVAMALGTPRSEIAVRPLLLGFEVAALGAVLGIAVGLGVEALFGDVMRGFQPLPVWKLSFQFDAFLRGAALGVILPFVAVIIPVWGAVRVHPIDAIRTSAASARGAGLSPWLARLRLPGKSLVQMPIRNVLRSPRRSLLTVLGIGVTITVLVALLGLVDSFYATIDTSRRVYAVDSDRAIVTLDRFHLAEDAEVTAISTSPVVGRSTTGIQVLGTVSSPKASLDVLLNVIDMHNEVWVPPVASGTVDDPSGGAGIVLTTRAAADLGVHVGDTIVLRHPRREGVASYALVESPVTVTGLTSMPLRYLSYMDSAQPDLMNLRGTTNVIDVTPAAGVGTDEFVRTLYGLPGVGSVQSTSVAVDSISKQLSEILGILRVIDAALLLLAALIAFNSTSINLDERSREQATMFAFGVPIRAVLAVAVVESVITGVVGTVIGIAGGRLVLNWMITRMLPDIIPDVQITDHLAARTVGIALGLGVLAVTLAPMLSYRRLARMDVPSTLRVME
jgi:putative ABC transport system permease protein